eukprot:GFKZ01010750.1.p1 GENE.GFKZ01010750.1~~GFKZ01010750.1.p1  ORF type:complete len:124 (-),score=19.46 GFKZ01010750.1:514-837(-)
MSDGPPASPSQTDFYSVKLNIKGRVQGVFYRASATEEAQRLGVVGYTMNMSDGSVEVLAQGSLQQVHDMISWCEKGPSMACVEAVEQVVPLDKVDTLDYDAFRVKRG